MAKNHNYTPKYESMREKEREKGGSKKEDKERTRIIKILAFFK